MRRCPTLEQLPPPSKQAGWPWAEETTQVPDTMPDGRPWPSITIRPKQGLPMWPTRRSALGQAAVATGSTG